MIRPITSETEGFRIDKEIFYGNKPVITGEFSTKNDIKENQVVLINDETFNSYLADLGLERVLNDYRLKNSTIKISPTEQSYNLILDSGTDKKIKWKSNDLQWKLKSGGSVEIFYRSYKVKRLKSQVTQISLDELNSKLIHNGLIGPDIKDNVSDTEPDFLRLTPKSNITDRIDFNYFMVHDIEYLKRSEEKSVAVKGAFTYYKSNNGSLPIKIVTYKELPSYRRLINPGGTIELVIGYKVDYDTEVKLSPIKYKIDDVIVKKSPALYKHPNIYFNPHKFDRILVKTSSGEIELKYKNRYLYHGRNGIRTASTIVTVPEGDKIIRSYIDTFEGDKLMVEVSSEDLIVYSLSDRINEYIIKYARLIYQKYDK